MRNVQRVAFVGVMLAVLSTAFWGVGAQQASAPAAGQREGGGGRMSAGPPEPTPRLADGTVNLGRAPGEKGVWSVPYITNMGERVIEADGTTVFARRSPTRRR